MTGTPRRLCGKALGAFAVLLLGACGGIPEAPAVQPLTAGVLDSLPTVTFEVPSAALPYLGE